MESRGCAQRALDSCATRARVWLERARRPSGRQGPPRRNKCASHTFFVRPVHGARETGISSARPTTRARDRGSGRATVLLRRERKRPVELTEQYQTADSDDHAVTIVPNSTGTRAVSFRRPAHRRREKMCRSPEERDRRLAPAVDALANPRKPRGKRSSCAGHIHLTRRPYDEISKTFQRARVTSEYACLHSIKSM